MTIELRKDGDINIHDVSEIVVSAREPIDLKPGMFCRKMFITHYTDHTKGISQLNLFSKGNDASQIAIYGDD